MKQLRSRLMMLGLISMVCAWSGLARASTATDISGLYYTGITSGGGLLSGGATDPHWTVTYASTDGGTTANPTYQGAAYVVNNSNVIGSGWTQNTSSAQWIIAPGATDPNNGNSVNTGGDFLPGNGNTGSNEGVYIYTLAFTIVGTGNGIVKNSVSISLTISADDQYAIYVNPTGNGTTVPTGTAAGSGTSAWNNTASVTLQNGTNGKNGNSQFVVGTNYLTIVVNNTNSVTGSSGSTARNASGLLVYQVGSAALINGNPVPEPGTVLMVMSALGIYGVGTWRRGRKHLPLAS
jgi:hypothetical protein